MAEKHYFSVCFASIITVTQLYVFMHAGKDAATEVLW